MTSRRGLTLIELLVAMLIVGVALTGLISLFFFGFRTTEGAQDMGIAYNISRQELERVRNIGFLRLPPNWSRVQGYDFDTVSQSWRESPSADPLFIATVIADPGVPPSGVDSTSLRRVRVTVTVRGKTAPLVVTETYLTRGGI